MHHRVLSRGHAEYANRGGVFGRGFDNLFERFIQWRDGLGGVPLDNENLGGEGAEVEGEQAEEGGERGAQAVNASVGGGLAELGVVMACHENKRDVWLVRTRL